MGVAVICLQKWCVPLGQSGQESDKAILGEIAKFFRQQPVKNEKNVFAQQNNAILSVRDKVPKIWVFTNFLG